MEIYSLRFDGDVLEILDQRLLPFEVVYVKCTSEKDVWDAINKMKIRGAPAIGVAASYAMYLGLKNFVGDRSQFLEKAKEIKDYLDSARPTAVNLSWATKRVLDKLYASSTFNVEELKQIALEEA